MNWSTWFSDTLIASRRTTKRVSSLLSSTSRRTCPYHLIDIQTLSSCLGILKEEDSPFTMVPLVSAIITMSARLPSPNVDIIEKALFAATGNVHSETVSSIARKMDRADAWWITCRLVDSCISVAKRDITLLPSGTLGALEALASHCDAMASPSNTIALLAIRERLRVLQDIAEGRP